MVMEVTDGVPLGSLAGIRIRAHWSVLVILGLMAWSLAIDVLPVDLPGRPPAVYWLVGVVTALIFYGCLLGHELGHAVLARRRGVVVEAVTLWLFGGITRISGEAATPASEAAIAAIGPAISLAVAVFFALAGLAFEAVRLQVMTAAALWLAVMNGALALFNLIPAFPLDGGRLLRALLWWRNGDHVRATRVATRVSAALSYGLMAFGLLEFFLSSPLNGLWLGVIAWFLLSAGRAESSRILLHDALQGLVVADVMSPQPVVAPDWLSVEEFIRDFSLTHSLTDLSIAGSPREAGWPRHPGAAEVCATRASANHRGA
jgi:Zn-dependent protease